MIVKDIMNGIMVGKSRNLIYYVRGGRLCVRRSAIPGKKRKWEEVGRSSKQIEAVGRFTAVQRFYKEYAKQVSPEVWRLVAKRKGRLSQNLFNSTNFNCFDGQGEMVDFMGFKFTEGELFLPRKMKVARVGNRFRVTWLEERDWKSAGRSDVMRVGVLYDELTRSPRLAMEVSGRRGDLQGEFTLNEKLGRAAHVYIFFAKADDTAFSPSFYARVEL